ncbi:MAG: nicotinamide-nucleotide amidohydrolase family protein [Bacteroidales bacterium]|nr:nicotinamide-nucleotide amidohydrolase family protein [Bacteroidales bacterium]
MITASVCTIGDEILIGQIVDTNSSTISRALGAVGVQVTHMVSIGDLRGDILGTLSQELENHDIVITTGGLGPTKDDITKGVLAELSGSTGYVEHAGQLAVIHDLLHSRGLEVLDVNQAQAQVPDRCEVIVNRRGTAPIMVFRLGKSTLYAMPGVPFETEAALPDVIADIAQHHELTSIRHRNVMTYGLAESALSKKIAAWEDALPADMHLAYLPGPLVGVKLRLSVYGGDPEEVESRLDAQLQSLRGLLGDTIYAWDDTTLEKALGELLLRKGKTLSAAESCTGGEISHLITSVAGSSAYYLGSVTSYAISVKENVLGVPAETIGKYGVVSSEVALAMAEGVRALTGSDYAVATTGLAGPGGGDGVNPDGTVWVAVSGPHGSESRKYQYRNDRIRNIERFSASALYFLLSFVKSDLSC